MCSRMMRPPANKRLRHPSWKMRLKMRRNGIYRLDRSSNVFTVKSMLQRNAMKVRANFAMVMNLDKCIGCHTCSVTCKNVWTNRKAWNTSGSIMSSPNLASVTRRTGKTRGKWNGGWEVKKGKLELKSGSRTKRLMNIFMNPDMPEIDDYYEPFTYDYGHLQTSPLAEAAPTARPRSQIDGRRMEKIEWGPNWEDDLAGEFENRRQDKNFKDIEAEVYAEFENSFQMYLPRICNHCINPSCVASCPSGSMYKREEDGIVLVDQDKCRSWRMCISSCPYKKVFYNWESGKAEKCTACYPRLEAGQLPCVRNLAWAGSVTTVSSCMTQTGSRRWRARKMSRISMRRRLGSF